MASKEQKLTFEKAVAQIEDTYLVYNKKEPREYLGAISKKRVGRFMHWVFEPDTYYELFFTNGCLKEISAFITKLYGKNEQQKCHGCHHKISINNKTNYCYRCRRKKE